LIVSSRAVRSRYSPHASDLLLYAAAVGLGLLAGYSLLEEPRLLKLLLLLPAGVFALTVSPERLFVGWLFCAPFVQGASGGGQHGHVFYKFLFLVPPLILLTRMAMGQVRRAHFWLIDAVPALLLLYVAARVELFPSQFGGSEASLRGVYTGIGIGVIGYYIAAFAKTSDRFPVSIAKSLLWSGIIVAVLALVDAATGWNPWNTREAGQGTQFRRAVSTFTSSGALGAYLGTGLVIAVAILAWKGPRPLRLPAVLLIVVSVPAMFVTLSRGPVLGAAAVVVSMALVANRARWPSLLIFAAVALLVFAAWGKISSTTLYEQRFGVTETFRTRAEVQRESLALFREKVVFGWGYNTYDEAKLTLPNRDPRLDNITSHNTFLTVLVELGVVGLVLIFVPWIVIGWRAISMAVRGGAERWVVAGCVGVPAAYVIGALTYDARFFSLVTALPWITLGLARNLLASQRTSIESVQ
jgi:O-antigen ligase